MDETKELLCNEIERESKKLLNMDPGTEQYKIAVDGYTKLLDRIIELHKWDKEFELKRDNLDAELDFKRTSQTNELNFKKEQLHNENTFKEKQLAGEKNDRFWRHFLTGASIVVSAAVTIWGTIVSLNFEKEGTVTTIVGRGFINKTLPKK